MKRMKKRIAILTCILFLFVCIAPAALAHSGRTDANGGHRDNKNVSGLGYYHYHHGYPAHLHPNGVCPYTAKKTSSSSSSSTSTSKPKAPTVKTSNAKVILNGKNLTFDTKPIIESGTTLVPMRPIFEAMGATVDWNESSKTATGVKGNTTVVLKIGSKSATINGQAKQLAVAAKTMNGRTLAPLRFVGEAFGGNVTWDAGSNTVTISTR